MASVMQRSRRGTMTMTLVLAAVVLLALREPAFSQAGRCAGAPKQASSKQGGSRRALATAVASPVAGESVEDDLPVEAALEAVPNSDSELFRELELRVSSPAMLLNHIAERYSSTSRILMEFVDNAFDSAEAFFDKTDNSYSRPVKIDILVDTERSAVTVTDNCQGMSSDTLARVTTNIGESQKRGQSFLNGQFGFGMQAFRACCSSLRVRSRLGADKPLLEITVDRESSHIDMREASAESYAGVPASGTEAALLGLEEHWISQETFSLEGVASEIEAHFERLLSRGNLDVTVRSPQGSTHSCKPLDYAAAGADVVVQQTVDLQDGQRAEVLLAVASNTLAAAWQRPARFFAKGRRIGDVANVNSFAKGSVHRWDVWSHPQLVGYIDVIGSDEGPLRPMITRDEFKNTRGRLNAYRELAEACEEPLAEALSSVNSVRSMKSLESLEEVLTTELRRVDKQEKRAERKNKKKKMVSFQDPNAPIVEVEEEEDSAPELSPEALATQEERLPKSLDSFQVKLVDGLEEDAGSKVQRSALVGQTIMVNIRHPDFQDRYRRTRSGAPKIDERLCSYLANIVSAHYRDITDELKDSGPVGRLEAFETMIGTYCRYEERLRKALPGLSRASEGVDITK
eukprot:TRINITY_DN8788_c0_g1_i1.p1 TRINITY_DN8788_c0_g1~~TRINITY_DN8788_c0_g1_i1.p1  ORF type:complete len:648 (-),score=156.97 TRINITY_DN8788_c0_g1_i1:19-1908(-)